METEKKDMQGVGQTLCEAKWQGRGRACRQGRAGHGKARHGTAGNDSVGHGTARQGSESQGMEKQGKAGQGMGLG